MCTESLQGNCQVIISTRGEGGGAIGGDVCCGGARVLGGGGCSGTGGGVICAMWQNFLFIF